MNFLRRYRHFSTSDVKAQPISSYFKDNAQPILTAATILAGVFAAGVYSVQTTSAIKELEQKNKGHMMVLEEKIKTSEEKIKTAKEEAKKEALERLFNIINQAEFESSKKAIQEIAIQKNNVK